MALETHAHEASSDLVNDGESLVGRERIRSIVDNESPAAASTTGSLSQLVLSTSEVSESDDERIKVVFGDLNWSVPEPLEVKQKHFECIANHVHDCPDLKVLDPLEVGRNTSILLCHFN